VSYNRYESKRPTLRKNEEHVEFRQPDEAGEIPLGDNERVVGTDGRRYTGPRFSTDRGRYIVRIVEPMVQTDVVKTFMVLGQSLDTAEATRLLHELEAALS